MRREQEQELKDKYQKLEKDTEDILIKAKKRCSKPIKCQYCGGPAYNRSNPGKYTCIKCGKIFDKTETAEANQATV